MLLIPQPPPRGCVLKPMTTENSKHLLFAAASARLCVETSMQIKSPALQMQPPPRGCVLKQHKLSYVKPTKRAAASARLCVETLTNQDLSPPFIKAAASARLCVETYDKIKNKFGIDAAAFVRLCVETDDSKQGTSQGSRSRLRAAVC